MKKCEVCGAELEVVETNVNADGTGVYYACPKFMAGDDEHTAYLEEHEGEDGYDHDVREGTMEDGVGYDMDGKPVFYLDGEEHTFSTGHTHATETEEYENVNGVIVRLSDGKRIDW